MVAGFMVAGFLGVSLAVWSGAYLTGAGTLTLSKDALKTVSDELVAVSNVTIDRTELIGNYTPSVHLYEGGIITISLIGGRVR